MVRHEMIDSNGANPADETEQEESVKLNLTDVDLMSDAFVDNEVVRTKTFLFVADLARKGPRYHGKKSALYMWNLLIVIIAIHENN